MSISAEETVTIVKEEGAGPVVDGRGVLGLEGQRGVAKSVRISIAFLIIIGKYRR